MGNKVVKSHARSLQFHLVFTWSHSISSLSQSCCPALSYWTKYNAFCRISFSTPQSLAVSQTWASSSIRGQMVYIRGLSLHLIQRVGAKDGTTWELIRELEYSGSSLPSWLNLSSANLLYRRIFPSLLTDRHSLSFYRGTGFGLVHRTR